jgi:hypothetical protein
MIFFLDDLSLVHVALIVGADMNANILNDTHVAMTNR